jgi:hypothetical protein
VLAAYVARLEAAVVAAYTNARHTFCGLDCIVTGAVTSIGVGDWGADLV